MTTSPQSQKVYPEPRIAVFGGLAAFVWEMWLVVPIIALIFARWGVSHR
tara:strand:- start:743 stop:889 length:147 start_codon:yes stop_codon:yes gene_type:complete